MCFNLFWNIRLFDRLTALYRHQEMLAAIADAANHIRIVEGTKLLALQLLDLDTLLHSLKARLLVAFSLAIR